MKVEVQPGYHVDTKQRKEPFYPGERLDLDDKEGKRLIDAGVVKATTAELSAGGNSQPPLNVVETVKLVMAAATSGELTRLKEGETRKGVLEAVSKREAQLDEQMTIAIIGNVHNPLDLDTYLKRSDMTDETRQPVLDAIDKRRTEIAKPE